MKVLGIVLKQKPGYITKMEAARGVVSDLYYKSNMRLKGVAFPYMANAYQGVYRNVYPHIAVELSNKQVIYVPVKKAGYQDDYVFLTDTTRSEWSQYLVPAQVPHMYNIVAFSGDIIKAINESTDSNIKEIFKNIDMSPELFSSRIKYTGEVKEYMYAIPTDKIGTLKSDLVDLGTLLVLFQDNLATVSNLAEWGYLEDEVFCKDLIRYTEKLQYDYSEIYRGTFFFLQDQNTNTVVDMELDKLYTLADLDNTVITTGSKKNLNYILNYNLKVLALGKNLSKITSKCELIDPITMRHGIERTLDMYATVSQPNDLNDLKKLKSIFVTDFIMTSNLSMERLSAVEHFWEALVNHVGQTNTVHDVALYIGQFHNLLSNPKVEPSTLDVVLSIPHKIVFDLPTISTIDNLLKRVKPSKLGIANQKVREELATGKLNNDTYVEFLRKSSAGSLELYTEALCICNNYVTVDMETLKKAVPPTLMKAMKDRQLKNVFAPYKLTGVQYRNKILPQIVPELLKHDSSSPTAEQKKLYYITSGVTDYSTLSEERIGDIIEAIRRIDKNKGDSLALASKYELELLNANDYRNIITGDATNCCMGAGTSKQKVYTKVPAFDQLIISDVEETEIVVASVLWKDLFDNIVIDNIEAVKFGGAREDLFASMIITSMQEIVERNDLKGFVQGANYNDICLFSKENKQKIAHPAIARDSDDNLFHNFYTDAEYVEVNFTDPLTNLVTQNEVLGYTDVTEFKLKSIQANI